VKPHDRHIWKMCTGIKIPFEIHRSVGIAIHEIQKTQKKTMEIYVVDLGGRIDH
jgi:hypothetical protein